MSHNLLSGIHSFLFDKPRQRSIESVRAAIADRRRLQTHDAAAQHAAPNTGPVPLPFEDQLHVRTWKQPAPGFDQGAAGTDVDQLRAISRTHLRGEDAVPAGALMSAPPSSLARHLLQPLPLPAPRIEL